MSQEVPRLMEYVLFNNETNPGKKRYQKVAYFQGKVSKGPMIPGNINKHFSV